jgi:hypothetical protein
MNHPVNVDGACLGFGLRCGLLLVQVDVNAGESVVDA